MPNQVVRIQRVVLLLFLSVLVVSCGKKDEEVGVGKFGMMPANTPEFTAVRFMRSIYLEPNIDVAVSLSSKRLARILQSYHTNRNVQRHLLNLKYDSVEITPQSANRVGRSEYSDTATITMFLSGEYNNNKIEDIRSVDLIKENGDWKVDYIHPDRFL